MMLKVRLYTGYLLLVLMLSITIACEDETETLDLPVILGADPPSFVGGETVTVALTSLEEFFSGNLDEPIKSAGGLELTSILRIDDFRAIATFESTSASQIDVHRFELEMNGKKGLIDISVVKKELGPGTAKGLGNTATAGAKNGTLTIRGSGTHFDSDVTLSVQGAQGLTLEFVHVTNSLTIQASYNIDMDQQPTVATIVVVDGNFTYEVPFTILSPSQLENQVADQVLTKGRVGTIVLKNSDSSLCASSRFSNIDSNVEIGEVDVVGEGEVEIQVRVPFDYPHSDLDITAVTYSKGGAFAELVNVSITLLEPAWIAVVPSRLEQESGEQIVELQSEGIDLTTVESLILEESENVVLAEWEATSSDNGSATFVLSSNTLSKEYGLAADDGQRIVNGVFVVTDWSDYSAASSERNVAIGDHIYLPIIVHSGEIDEDDFSVEGDEDIDVVSATYLDTGSVVVEIAVSKDANIGYGNLTLRDSDSSFEVILKLVSSRI